MLPSLTQFVHNIIQVLRYSPKHTRNFISTCSDWRLSFPAQFPNRAVPSYRILPKRENKCHITLSAHSPPLLWLPRSSQPISCSNLAICRQLCSAHKAFIFVLRKDRLTREITPNHERHEFQVDNCLYRNSNNDSTIALLNVSGCCFTVKGEAGHSYVYEIHCNYWQAVGPTQGEAVVAWSWPCISILEPRLRISGAVPPLLYMLS